MAVTRFARVREPKISQDHTTGVIEVTESYIAHLDNPREPRKQILLERPDLGPFQPHPQEPTARAVSLDAKARKHSLIFDVVVRWTSDISIPAVPYDEPARVTVETVDRTVPFIFDHEGRPLVNTAGDLIEAEDEDQMLIFRVEKKISPNYPDWLLDYGQALNSDPVTFKGRTLAPKTLKIAKIKIGDEQQQDDYPYLQLSLELIYNHDTWERYFGNRGNRELTIVKKPTRNGKFIYVTAAVPIVDDTGKPISEPQFLDEDGRRHRIDSNGRLVTLAEELAAIKRNQPIETTVKHPLDPDDIIVLKRTRKKPRPFVGVLPLS